MRVRCRFQVLLLVPTAFNFQLCVWPYAITCTPSLRPSHLNGLQWGSIAEVNNLTKAKNRE